MVEAPSFDAIVGERISERRRRLLMSQTELARQISARSGVKMYQVTLSRIEQGTQPMRVSELVAASSVLGVPIQEILGEAGLSGDGCYVCAAARPILEKALSILPNAKTRPQPEG
jgi:transcriptional regulator with XRE-family HTH domain